MSAKLFTTQEAAQMIGYTDSRLRVPARSARKYTVGTT